MKPRADAEGTLYGRASRALGWSFFSAFLGKISLTGLGILLARLLGPEQFGTAAVALVALLAVTSFNDIGVSLAIVRWPDEPGEIAPTVVTISVVASLVFYGGLLLESTDFATALGSPAAAPVIRVLALSVVTNGVVAVPAALLERYFLQGRKAIADQVHGILSVGLSVFLAWLGFGAMSIAIGQVVGAIAGGILIVRFAPLPLRMGFDIAKARELIKFGLPLAGATFVVFLVGNIDNLLTGHILGATALGFYVLAWNLSSLPVTMLSQPVRNVTPALFSRLQHDPAAMRTSFMSALTLLSSITLPVCLLISGSAQPLVGFVYGARWAPAAQALVWLAALGAMRVLFDLMYDYFVVLVKSRAVLVIQLIWLMTLIPAVVVGGRLDGIRGVALAGAVVAALIVLPCYLAELRNVGLRLGALAARIWLPLAAAACVGISARTIAKVIPDNFAACALGGLMALIAIGLLSFRIRPAITELRAVSGSSHHIPHSALDSAPTAESTPDLARSSRSVPRHVDPARQAAAMQVLLDLAVPAPTLRDMIKPIPLHRDITGPLPLYRDISEVLPVYKQAVTATGWDPATSHRSGKSGRHPYARRRPASSRTSAEAGHGHSRGLRPRQ
jgi:O-antigen/teichoic acid export membrane protein